MISAPASGSSELSERTPSATHAAAYARLKAEVTSAGILERSYSFYLPLIALSFGGYALSIWAIIVWNSPLSLALACLAFSFFTVQLAGLMHDSGHRAVFRSTRLNTLLGLASTAAIGMVLPSWVERHNQHHAHPNQQDADPDMEVPFLVLSREDYVGKDAVQLLTARWQAYYYYPLGALVGFSNRLGSATYFLRKRSPASLARLALYLPAIACLFVVPFFIFPLEKAMFVLLLAHVSTGIYLANCFAPNHKGMPTFEQDARASFLEQQVTTARNVRGGLLTDLLLVGLNHQVEHHLFPTCPRNKLKLLGPYVREVCAEQGLEYAEVSFLRTNQMLLKHLHGIARVHAVSAVRNQETDEFA